MPDGRSLDASISPSRTGPAASLAPHFPVWAPVSAVLAVLIGLVAARQALAGVLLLTVVAFATLVASDVSTVAQRAKRFLAARRWLVGAALAVVLYLALSCAWSPDPVQSLGKVLLVAALLIAVTALALALEDTVPAETGRLAWAVLGALAAGAAYLLAEELTDHRFKIWLFTVVPALRPHERHLVTEGDIVQGISAYLSNRNVAVLVLLTWPGILLLRALVVRRLPWIGLSAALLVVVALTAMYSVHASSRLALAGGFVTLILALALPRRAVTIVMAGWLALWVLMVPIASALYSRGLHLDERVPYSFRARIILWNYTADQIAKRPLLGVGVDGTKPLDRARKKNWETRPGHVYPQRTAEHAHNVYLQLWYELGLLGVALVATFGVLVIRAAGMLGPAARPAALATVVTTALLVATSWGLWQPWFLGSIALAAMVLVLAVAAAGGRADNEPTAPSAPARPKAPPAKPPGTAATA